MKKLIAILILTVSLSGAINLDYPEELALAFNDAAENMLREYERACMDSVCVCGVWIEMPDEVRSALLVKAAAYRLQVIASWDALNDYIMSD